MSAGASKATELAVSRAEDLYRRHVKSLPPGEKAKLMELIGRDLVAQRVGRTDRSVMELHGLGREIWNGIDAQEYVDRLRGEWSRFK